VASTSLRERPAGPTAAKEEVRIGNYHAFMPGGIAFIKDHAAGIVVNVGWGNRDRPGSAAPDYSINQIHFNQDGANIYFNWGRVGADAAVGRLQADAAVDVVIHLPRVTWFPFNTVYNSVEGGLDATAITPDGRFLPWRLRLSHLPASNDTNYLPEASIRLSLKPQESVFFSAGFGELPRLEAVNGILNESREKYDASRASSTGKWGDFLGAIAANLNNSKLYSSYTGIQCHIVGRKSWVTQPDYPPIFCWDSFFNALLASLEDPEGARATLRAVFHFQTPEGMIANVAGWNGTRSGTMTVGNSQPPVGALCLWLVHKRWPDLALLAEIYPKLLKWHDWWFKYRDGNGDGLLEWGSVTGIFQEARYATGWDDSPQWNGVEMVGSHMNADAIDLNSLWSADAHYLSMIADELGDYKGSQRLRDEHLSMNERLNARLWNDELGVYCHRLWSKPGEGKFITRLTPANFYPLMCGAPDQGRAARMLSILTNPKKFWGDWIVPTLAYDDPDYWVQGYWKGHIWAPVNYLLWHGLKRYATQAQQAEFVRKSIDLFMRNWTDHGTCNENFNSIDGTGDDYPHYTWGALMCQIALESLVDFDEAGRLFSVNNRHITEEIELRNVPAGGRRFRVRAKSGKVEISPEVV